MDRKKLKLVVPKERQPWVSDTLTLSPDSDSSRESDFLEIEQDDASVDSDIRKRFSIRSAGSLPLKVHFVSKSETSRSKQSSLLRMNSAKAAIWEKSELKDCTLDDIVRRVNHPFFSDERTKRILFSCYRGFCTRKELLTALQKHYENPIVPPDCEVWKQGIGPNAEEKAKKIIRIKILNLVRYWLRDFFDDFEEVDVNHIRSWTSNLLRNWNDVTVKCVDSIRRELRSIQIGKRHQVIQDKNLNNFPPPLWNSERDLQNIFDVPSEEIARQMCLIDHELFASIRPYEFIGQSWKKKSKATKAPNLTRIILHFNELSCWTQAMILYETKLRKRARVLARLLKICFYLDRYDNLNSLCAIMTGIRSSPIFRLKKTFASLKPKHTRLLNRFKELLKLEKNQTNLRTRMSSLVEPAIPHVGLFLSDILYIDEGNGSSIHGKINFQKYTKIYERMEWCLLFQRYPFSFQKLEKVQDELLQSFKIIPNEFLYTLSLSLEPRDC